MRLPGGVGRVGETTRKEALDSSRTVSFFPIRYGGAAEGWQGETHRTESKQAANNFFFSDREGDVLLWHEAFAANRIQRLPLLTSSSSLELGMVIWYVCMVVEVWYHSHIQTKAHLFGLGGAAVPYHTHLFYVSGRNDISTGGQRKGIIVIRLYVPYRCPDKESAGNDFPSENRRKGQSRRQLPTLHALYSDASRLHKSSS